MKNDCLYLKSYRKEITILELTIDVPYYDDVKKRFMYGTYEETLLRLFNNKREHKDDILEIRNYYGSNKITMIVNLTYYLEDRKCDEKEAIKYLKRFMIDRFDLTDEDVKEYKHKGYIYEIYENENNLDVLNDYIIVNEW